MGGQNKLYIDPINAYVYYVSYNIMNILHTRPTKYTLFRSLYTLVYQLMLYIKFKVTHTRCDRLPPYHLIEI